MAEWFENFRQDVRNAINNHVISSIQSLTARDGFVFCIGVAVGAGIGFTVGAGMMAASLSVAAIFNVVVSWITGTKASRSNRNPSAFEPLILKPTCVKDLEKIYFHGLDHIAGLNETQIQQLKENLEGDVDGNVKKLTDCKTLEDILQLLSDLNLVQPKSYRKILTILKNSNIDLNVEHLAFNVDGLENAVSDIEETGTPRDYEHDQFELDVLILHSEDDNKDVDAFKKHLIADSGIHRLSVQAYEEFGIGKGKLRLLGDIFTRTRFIFVFMTKNLQDENLSRALTEAALVDSIEDDKKKFRIVPVWTTREKLKVPEMRALQGLKYWYLTSTNEASSYLYNLNRTLVEGRATFVRAN